MEGQFKSMVAIPIIKQIRKLINLFFNKDFRALLPDSEREKENNDN